MVQHEWHGRWSAGSARPQHEIAVLESSQNALGEGCQEIGSLIVAKLFMRFMAWIVSLGIARAFGAIDGKWQLPQ